MHAGATMRQVAARLPVIGPRSIELAAVRPAMTTRPAALRVAPTANQWTQLATLPGAVVHDISFPTATVGYAAAELGQVWKTTDGGAHWSEIVNLGFPYYWYGVTTLGPKDVVVSGFDDSNFEGIIRWSHDGGHTWTSDIVLTTTGWSYRVRFANPQDGLVVDGLNTSAPNAAHYTTDGGATATDWTEDVPDPNGGWFGNEFSLLGDLHAVVAGITYCSSANAGQTWACGPSVDSVFDGAVDYVDKKHGWDGGGEISRPSRAGCTARATAASTGAGVRCRAPSRSAKSVSSRPKSGGQPAATSIRTSGASISAPTAARRGHSTWTRTDTRWTPARAERSATNTGSGARGTTTT